MLQSTQPESTTRESDGQDVYLRIPIPELSTECDGRQIYHFDVISLAYQVRRFLSSALHHKPYRLSEDAEYVQGALCFRVLGPPQIQVDMLEKERLYEASSKDIVHAISYLTSPLQTVEEGLEANRSKAEYHKLYSVAADLVRENQKRRIQAEIEQGGEVVTIGGKIGTTLDHQAAKRSLRPPRDGETERAIWKFVSRDSDGVLITEEGYLFQLDSSLEQTIELNIPTPCEAEVSKTRVSRDVRIITRVISADELDE